MKKINFHLFGHASVLMSCDGCSVLTDPWFSTPSNFGAFDAFPKVKVPTSEEISRIDAIQISHVHDDHLCSQSLSVFRKDIPIFITKYINKNFYNRIKVLGFTNIIEIIPGLEGTQFGPFRFYQFPLVGSLAFDSSLVVQVEKQYFYLNNDCLLADANYSLMRSVFGSFQGCFLGYSPFGPYPLSYDLSECKGLNESLSSEKILKSLQQMHWDHISLICKKLSPQWVVPYASGVRFLNEDSVLFNAMFSNPYAIQHIDLHKAKPVIMWPGEQIDQDGKKNSERTLNVDETGFEIEKPLGKVQIPVAVIRPGLTKLLASDEIKSQSGIYLQALISLLNHESKKWLSPTSVKFNIVTKDENVVFAFQFDGSEIKSVDSLQTCDLEVSYPSALFDEIVRGRISLRRIPYSYTKYFRVKINKLVYNQQGVHTWGAGWKAPALDV